MLKGGESGCRVGGAGGRGEEEGGGRVVGGSSGDHGGSFSPFVFPWSSLLLHGCLIYRLAE